MSSSTTNSDHLFAKYSRTLVVGTMGACMAIGLLNYFVDPYNIYGNNRLGVYISSEREAKQNLIKSYPHTAVLLGNSKSALISVADVEGTVVFNGGIAGASMSEIYFFAQRYVVDQNRVFLGVSLGQQGGLNVADQDVFRPLTMSRRLGYALSLKSTEYTIKTISKYAQGEASSLGKDGTQNPEKWFKAHSKTDVDLLQYRVEEFVDGWISQLSTAPSEFIAFQKMKELMQARGIHLDVFIYPIHPDIRASFTPHQWQQLEEWLAEMRKIYPEITDFSRGGYSEYDHFTATDPVHFMPKTGAKMIEELIQSGQ